MPPPAVGPHARHPLPWARPRQHPAPARGGQPRTPRKASGRPGPHRPWPGGTGRPHGHVDRVVSLRHHQPRADPPGARQLGGGPAERADAPPDVDPLALVELA
eukprot:4754155-Alexandrium_andersonii.AAC.1